MICEQHGIEHSEGFPCDEYERHRELIHKLNHGDATAGVGRAKTLTTWETKLTAIDNPDGEVLDVRVERANVREYAIGYVGLARDDEQGA